MSSFNNEVDTWKNEKKYWNGLDYKDIDTEEEKEKVRKIISASDSEYNEMSTAHLIVKPITIIVIILAISAILITKAAKLSKVDDKKLDRSSYAITATVDNQISETTGEK